MLLSPGWNKRNPSPSWNAPSPSQQHYQPELSSTTISKSVRAVLEFKDKASIDWCAEAQALNPFDKRPCLFEKSKAPRIVTRFWAGTVSCHVRGKQKISGYISFYHNSPYHVWNSPQHSSNCVSPALRQSGERKPKPWNWGLCTTHWESWLQLICNSGRFSLPYRNQNAATLMHKGVLSIKFLN